MICDYCKRPGHSRDRCYKLHGYPQMSNQNPSRLNKGKGLMVDTQGENCSGEENHKGNHDDASHQLTKEQYVQFMEMLQHFQAGKDNTQQHNDFSGGAVNSAFAGMIACTSSVDFGKLSCRCPHNKIDSWILDSGASNHMTSNITLLTNIAYLPCPLLITLPNGYKVKVVKIGSVVLA